MIDNLMNLEPHYQWLIFAALMGIAEIIVPGIFLIWISLAAALTGIIALLLPMPVALQLLLFAAISVGTVYIGRRWYLSREHISQDPMLNDRSARMVGQSVIVVDAVSAHKGRVRVGDSEWPARGPDLPVGATARIAAVTDGIVNIEPVN